MATCWVITEGIAGTENQCVGVAEALAVPHEIKRITLKQPWKTLSPYIGFETHNTFQPLIQPPYPDLLITSGRKAIAASRFIKKQSQRKTKTLHIQDPRIPSKYFDLVAVPNHDPMRGENVIVTQASPNRITRTQINNAKAAFPSLGKLPSPRIAVLIGGNSKAYHMNEEITQKLAHDLSHIDASLMVTCSRRTGKQNEMILKKSLDNDHNYFWNGEGNNPYLAFLGWADFIIVTADSASMISESCTTGKPTYMIPLDGGSKRINRLHHNLTTQGKLKIFDGTLEHYDYEPLNDAQFVANALKTRFGALLNTDD